MFNACHHLRLSAAVAAGVIARVAGSLPIAWLRGRAHRATSPSMNRGVTR